MSSQSQTFAVMAVDPGMTTGIAQMHVYSGHKSAHKGKLPDHAIVRHKAKQIEVKEFLPSSHQMAAEDYTGIKTIKANPYRAYTDHALQIVDEWIQFRALSTSRATYSIAPECVFLVIEDYTFPAHSKNTKKFAHSPVFITHAILGALAQHALVHERAGFGPCEANNIQFIMPADKTILKDEMLDKAGLLARGGVTGKAVRAMEHANDATKLAIALLRKMSVPGALVPFDGVRPSFTARKIEHPEGIIPAHRFADPADPALPLPRRKGSLRRAGQPGLARNRP